MLGVTPQYIDKIQDQLTFVNVKGKVKPQIDLHGSKTIQYLSERERKSGQQQIETQEPDPTQPKTNYGKLSSGLPGADTEELKALKKEKLEEEIEKIKIHNQQGRGSLIEKKLVELLFGKMYQIDVDQIKPLGNDISPKIIAIINEKNKQKAKEITENLKLKDDRKKEIESILNAGEREIKTKIISVFEDTIGSILKNIQSEIDNFLNILEVSE